MRAALRIIRADFKSVPIAVEPQAGRLRHPQQRARHAAAALALARVAHVARHLRGVLPRRGAAVGSGRLAARALRAALPALARRPAPARASPQRQPRRQDSPRQKYRVESVRPDRVAAAARLL